MNMKRERIYIVPTEYGFMYAAGIFVSLIGGAVYNNNLAFMLCFFLVALFLIGMVQTHNNMKNINLEKVIIFLSPSESVGHGVFWIKSNNSEGHSQLRLECDSHGDKIDVNVELIYQKSLHPQYFDFQTGEWGKKRLKRIKMSTRYPFGFFYVWRYFDCPMDYYVYPKPGGDKSIDHVEIEGNNEGLYRKLKGDDFSEHKKYVLGDSQKHIDWKAYARGRPLLTKKFDEGDRHTYLLDYDKAAGNQERRVRQLSKWIQDCEEQQNTYALKVKDKTVPVGSGEKHKAHCLRLLASLREVS
jgi:uncharacterized protein (DUF58 family)